MLNLPAFCFHESGIAIIHVLLLFSCSSSCIALIWIFLIDGEEHHGQYGR